MPSNVQSFNEYTNKEGGDGSGPRLNTRSGNRHTRSSASGSRIVKHSNGNVVSGKGFNKSFNSSRGDGFRGGKSTTNPGSGSAFRNMGKERYGQGQPGRDRDQGQIFGSKYPPEKKKVYRSKTSPQEEIRTEFKKYLTVGLKTQDWTKALLHVQQRLEYNVIDEGKSVNGKLIATILNIYSKAGEYQKAYNLFLSIQNRLVGGKWLENSHYYRHIKLTSYHYQIILDACASHSESSASSSSGSAPADGSVRSKEPHPTTTTTGAGTAATVMRQPYEVALDIIHSMVNNGGNGLTRDVQLPTADMERYPRRGRPGRTPLPTAVHFTSAMLACMSARQFENAYDVFLLARANGVIPDTILFNTALNCMIQLSTGTGNSRKETGSETTSKLSPYTISAADISAFFRSMEPTVFKDAYSYGAMIKFCQKMNDYPLALKYLNEANSRLLVNKGLVDIVTQLALRNKDVDKARELLLLSASLPTYIVPTSAMLPAPDDGTATSLLQGSGGCNGDRNKGSGTSDSRNVGNSAAGYGPQIESNNNSFGTNPIGHSSGSNSGSNNAFATQIADNEYHDDGHVQPEVSSAEHVLATNHLSTTNTDISALRADTNTYQKVVPAMLEHSSVNPTTGSTTNKKLKAASLQTTTLKNAELNRLHKNIHVATALASNVSPKGGNYGNDHEDMLVSVDDARTAAAVDDTLLPPPKPTANSVSVLSNNNHLIRRVTHNISGTTNAQMLNIAPISSYTSLLYSYSLMPHDSARGIITTAPTAKKGKLNTKPVNNGRYALDALENMQKRGMRVTKSHLMNVMTALETDFVYTTEIDTVTQVKTAGSKDRSMGTDIETSTSRSDLSKPPLPGKWIPAITSKRTKQVDEVYNNGLVSGAFKPLKLKNSDALTTTGAEEGGVVVVGNVLSNKCDIRKLPRVSVLVSAALRHLLKVQLLGEYTAIMKKIEETPRLQRHNLPIVTSDFLFITGTESPTRTNEGDTTQSGTGADLNLRQEVMNVVDSIEPMGILEIKEHTRSGTIGITKESLKQWMNTVIALKQLEKGEDFAVGGEDNDEEINVTDSAKRRNSDGANGVLRLSESASIAITQA